MLDLPAASAVTHCLFRQLCNAKDVQAFGHSPGWAEGSLVMAENVMALYFGAEQPAWMALGEY